MMTFEFDVYFHQSHFLAIKVCKSIMNINPELM